MRMVHFLLFALVHFFLFDLCLGYGESRCIIQSDNSTYCEHLELKFDEPIEFTSSSSVVYIDHSKGAISRTTLQQFQNAEYLGFYADDVISVEDGVLCALPNLKDLSITHSTFPTLTKGLLSGCHKIEKFRTYCSLEEDALHEMTGVKDLELSEASTADLRKVYLEPLKQLKKLLLEIGELNEVDPGLFCSSSELESVQLYLRSPIQVTESLFGGCNNLKKVYITGRDAVIEGNPFAKMPQLEELELSTVQRSHITKEFLTGFPNLQSFLFQGETKIDGDAFGNVPHLTYLRLERTGAQDSILEALHPLSEIVILEIGSNDIKNLDALPALTNLERLNVGYNSISKFDFSALKQKLPKLKELNLVNNPLIPELEEELKKVETIKIKLVRHIIPL